MSDKQVLERLNQMSDRINAIEQQLPALSKSSLATGFLFTAPEGTALVQISPQGSNRPVYQLMAVTPDTPLLTRHHKAS